MLRMQSCDTRGFGRLGPAAVALGLPVRCRQFHADENDQDALGVNIVKRALEEPLPRSPKRVKRARDVKRYRQHRGNDGFNAASEVFENSSRRVSTRKGHPHRPAETQPRRGPYAHNRSMIAASRIKGRRVEWTHGRGMGGMVWGCKFPGLTSRLVC